MRSSDGNALLIGKRRLKKRLGESFVVASAGLLAIGATVAVALALAPRSAGLRAGDSGPVEIANIIHNPPLLAESDTNVKLTFELICPAYNEANGTWIHVETYRTNSLYGGVARVGITG